MSNLIERLGRSVDHLIQRKMTPASERDALERDLVRQESQKDSSKNGHSNDKDVYLGFNLGDPTNPFPIFRSELNNTKTTSVKEEGK